MYSGNFGVIMNCKCGKKAEYFINSPIYNVYSGLMNLTERFYLCEYHKNKAIKMGYEIFVI